MTDETKPPAGDETPDGAPVVATVTKDFEGVPDGEVWPRAFAKGDTVSGGLAEVAVAEGWAKKPKA